MSHPTQKDPFYTFMVKVVRILSSKNVQHSFKKERIDLWKDDRDVPTPKELENIIDILKEQNNADLLHEFYLMKYRWLLNVSDRFYSFYSATKKPKSLAEYLE